jgi:hypothetical protein
MATRDTVCVTSLFTIPDAAQESAQTTGGLYIFDSQMGQSITQKQSICEPLLRLLGGRGEGHCVDHPRIMCNYRRARLRKLDNVYRGAVLILARVPFPWHIDGDPQPRPEMVNFIQTLKSDLFLGSFAEDNSPVTNGASAFSMALPEPLRGFERYGLVSSGEIP